MKRVILAFLAASMLFTGCASTYVSTRESKAECDRYNRCIQDCECRHMDSVGPDFTRAICASQCEDSTCTEYIVNERQHDMIVHTVFITFIALVLIGLF